MSGETRYVAEIAEIISRDVFKHFRWNVAALTDTNFDCVKSQEHSRKDDHTHPVDVVFYYDDPYLNKTVYLNTDLKSYKKGSISQAQIRGALKSLASTIDCARVSSQWRGRYASSVSGNPEVRGMLFVYNHDNEYDKDFYNHIKPYNPSKTEKQLNTDSLPLKKKQYLHIVEPKLINYLLTIVNDMKVLAYEDKFPKDKYMFFYPELTLHKTHGNALTRAATIEMLSGPFLVIKHPAIERINDETSAKEVVGDSGYLIYYNRPGGDHREFMYFFDLISRFQILDSGEKIKLRVACLDRDKEITANYYQAIEAYSQAWGFDQYKRSLLENIEFELVETYRTSLSSIDVGWRS
mgnify:CR=1 FL=1